jgi:hypothetical protein
MNRVGAAEIHAKSVAVATEGCRVIGRCVFGSTSIARNTQYIN